MSNHDVMLEQSMAVLQRIDQCIKDCIPPESDVGEDIAHALNEITAHIFDGNEQLAEEFWNIRKLPAEETGLFPISEEALDFAERATTYAANQQ